MNSNLIKFQGKSRKGSENVNLRQHILSFQNLHNRYKEKLHALIEELNNENIDEQQSALIKADIKLLHIHIDIIEEQIKNLAKILN
jgi:transposase